MRKLASFLLAALMLTQTVPFAMAADGTASGTSVETQYVNTAVDHTTYGWVTEAATIDDEGRVSVTIMEVPNFETKSYTTVCSLTTDEHKSSETSGVRGKALCGLLKKNAFAEVRFNSKGECIDFELVEYGVPAFMDSASYGGELTANGGYAGRMVAQGWIMAADKDENTITIGDGNHVVQLFEETYALADDCKIYVVDNSTIDGTVTVHAKKYTSDGTWNKVKDATFDDIRVCERGDDGEIYYVPEKYSALCIFDSNYKNSWKDGSAKVSELYLSANPLVLTESDLSTPDGVTYDGASWYQGHKMTEERVWYGFNGATEPTEYMAGRLYDIGDSNTNIMMFVGDGGELTLLDMGNLIAQYQYYLKIEKCGYDPREVDTIFLTHGHADHYEAMYEFSGMIRRAGKDLTTMANGYIEGSVVSNDDLTVELAPMVTDQATLYTINETLEWDRWQYFMGEGTAIYPLRAIGHSRDTTNFCFKLTATEDDKFFEEGEIIGWIYQGGFGMISNVNRGAERIAFMNSLMYAQSTLTAWMEAQCEKLYFMNQHTLTYPYLELDKAAKIADVPLMSIVDEGAWVTTNVHENRVSMMMYQDLEENYLAGEALYDKILGQYGAYDKAFRERNQYSIDTIEEHGPWKREGGEYKINVESVLVLHGYDGIYNKDCEEIRGQKNVYGADMGDGVPVPWVSYSHDPDSWYVQVVASVEDDYQGTFDVYNNWYQGEYISHNKSKEGTVVPYSKITSGLVEMGNDPDNWREVLRTERFDTQEEAEAYALALTNGAYTKPYHTYNMAGESLYNYGDLQDHTLDDYGRSSHPIVTYTVQLDKSSNIILGDSFEETFVAEKADSDSDAALNWAIENDVIRSNSAAAYKPGAPCTRAKALTFLWRAAGSPVVNHTMNFVDVPADADYAQAVRWALSQGITAGTSSTTFSPDAPCTRAQIMAFLYNQGGLDTLNVKDNPFGDVAESSYYYNAALWAAERGIVSGNAFTPDAPCTQADILAFLFRALAE